MAVNSFTSLFSGFVIFSYLGYMSLRTHKPIDQVATEGETSLTYNNADRCLLILNRKEGNVLFNDAFNTFYLRLYGVRHMVKDHSDSEKGNPLPPHRLLFPISTKGSFICTIPHTG